MKTFFILVIFSLFLLVLAGCVSKPVVVTPEAGPDKLIQLAQEESDKNRYNRALVYYEAVIEKYPTRIDSLCAAEYEIAFIHYKQKKYAEARVELNELLLRYESPDAETYPSQYKILANIVLAKVVEKEGKK